jgi:AraC-like DNA-binding protein
MAGLTLDWLHVVALLGAIQGVFLAGVLATKRSNRTASRLLAVAMLAFSVYLASAVYHAAGLEQRFPHFFGAAYPLPVLFAPLIYLYAVCAADRTRRLTRRDALHFVPFAALVIGSLPIYLMGGTEKIAFYRALLRGEVPLLLRIADPLKLLIGVIYTVLTMLFLVRHREQVKDNYSSTERVNLRWLLWLGGAAAAIWALAVAFQVLESTGMMRIGGGEKYITLGIAIVVYGIGYMGLRQPEIFRYATAEFAVQQRAGVTADVSADVSADEREGSPRYERSGLTERQAMKLEAALTELMDRERPWQDSGLTLADLATRLDTTPHKLSEVLNSQLGQTFYDFVNGYRVREVQRRIAAGEARSVKILSLAMDAGFASKSTFNVVFKKFTSQTPSDYRQEAGA